MLRFLVLVDSTDTRDIRSRWVSAISADNTSELRELLEESFKKADSNTASNSQPLWEVGASNGKTALMVASKVGDVAFAEQLVELGSNIQARTKTDGTAFMFAVLGDRQPIAKWLVGLGANINAQGSNGWTGVMIASAKGLDDTLEWLLSEGANAQTPDVYGFSPLMRASDNGHVEAVRMLLNQGVGRSQSAGNNASDNVADSNSESHSDSGSHSNGIVSAGSGVDVHWQDELENTALHYAVAGAHVEIVRLLLSDEANIETKNSAGLSALDLAINAVDAAEGSTASQNIQRQRKEVLKMLRQFEKPG